MKGSRYFFYKLLILTILITFYNLWHPGNIYGFREDTPLIFCKAIPALDFRQAQPQTYFIKETDR